jgi:hypothetical protein
MTESFKQELFQTGYIHKLLPVDRSRSTEARLLNKKITQAKPLWPCGTLNPWEKHGEGTMSLADGNLQITAPLRTEPTAPMRHYVGYGWMKAALVFPEGVDWRGYNRVRCKVKPLCNGYNAPFLTMGLKNDGEHKIPDIYGREGAHVINLDNHQWNDCVWDPIYRAIKSWNSPLN